MPLSAAPEKRNKGRRGGSRMAVGVPDERGRRSSCRGALENEHCGNRPLTAAAVHGREHSGRGGKGKVFLYHHGSLLGFCLAGGLSRGEDLCEWEACLACLLPVAPPSCCAVLRCALCRGSRRAGRQRLCRLPQRPGAAPVGAPAALL